MAEPAARAPSVLVARPLVPVARARPFRRRARVPIRSRGAPARSRAARPLVPAACARPFPWRAPTRFSVNRAPPVPQYAPPVSV